MSLAAALHQGLAGLGLDLPAAVQARLLAYVALLKKWNATYNLTAIRDEGEMVTQHLLDSLSVLPALQELALVGRRWADIGSGAGLPGIPLAIVRPDLDMTLVETVAKKSAFQRQAKIELGLANLTVVNRRVEELPGGGFDAVISRAFAELADFVRLAGHLPTPDGRLYAMKGLLPEDEISRLPQAWAVADCIRLSVPGLDAQRHLIILERA
ncbi:16S rRNA (guanine(527)-N(7))-methyltransferase RsmG [Sulfuritalea sp.]|uniref:16S rRNA (guanine(527)-N(7))-methyltransferase RsmG n=1 Tax=Sulfuritalea sp. TaxID=2480090 RepID=UPI00286E201A|nr:16S rRNA (guanine(527)-N(7))-methyltransferase RsmG [Sulfuritalea sp.]